MSFTAAFPIRVSIPSVHLGCSRPGAIVPIVCVRDDPGAGEKLAAATLTGIHPFVTLGTLIYLTLAINTKKIRNNFSVCKVSDQGKTVNVNLLLFKSRYLKRGQARAAKGKDSRGAEPEESL